MMLLYPKRVYDTLERMVLNQAPSEELAEYGEKEVRKRLLKRYDSVNQLRRKYKQQEITYWTLPHGEIQFEFQMLLNATSRMIEDKYGTD